MTHTYTFNSNRLASLLSCKQMRRCLGRRKQCGLRLPAWTVTQVQVRSRGVCHALDSSVCGCCLGFILHYKSGYWVLRCVTAASLEKFWKWAGWILDDASKVHLWHVLDKGSFPRFLLWLAISHPLALKEQHWRTTLKPTARGENRTFDMPLPPWTLMILMWTHWGREPIEALYNDNVWTVLPVSTRRATRRL